MISFPNYKWLVFSLCAAGAATANGSYYSNKKIGTLHSPDSRPCAFFYLEGVPNVDSSNSGWVALRKSHPSFKEVFAVLVAAKLGDKAVTINTTGVGVPDCTNHIEVISIQLH